MARRRRFGDGSHVRGAIAVAVLMAGCATPKRAIIGGSIGVGACALMVGHALSVERVAWGWSAP